MLNFELINAKFIKSLLDSVFAAERGSWQRWKSSTFSPLLPAKWSTIWNESQSAYEWRSFDPQVFEIKAQNSKGQIIFQYHNKHGRPFYNVHAV